LYKTVIVIITAINLINYDYCDSADVKNLFENTVLLPGRIFTIFFFFLMNFSVEDTKKHVKIKFIVDQIFFSLTTLIEHHLLIKMTSVSLQITKPNYVTPRIISPLNVSIDASALLEVIETIYYDNSADENASTTRLIGTLLGTHSDDGHINIKTAYIVPHEEKDGELIFAESHHFSTYQLYKRSNLDLQVVGWFSTSDKLDLSTGLLHEFYSKNSTTSPQILLTLNHKNENGEIISPIIKTYISGPVGLPNTSSLAHSLGLDKSGAYAFTEVENNVNYSKNELTTLKFINKAAKNETQLTTITSNDELKQLENTLHNISDMIKILSDYSNRVSNDEIKGDEKIGQLLLSALKFNIGESEITEFQSKMEKHNNDTLLIEYLSSCIQQQLELSSKLTNFVLPEDALK
jgi:translation initiation factor 3 subunit F